MRVWDRKDGDAQYMQKIADNTYDFVHSSHCLEHMHDVKIALKNWIRITKPGGYLIITIPDEDLYEQGHWPSRFNQDHKHTFTICKKKSWSPVSINIMELLMSFSNVVAVEKIELIRDFYHEALKRNGFDQTRTITTESSVELILLKMI